MSLFCNLQYLVNSNLVKVLNIAHQVVIEITLLYLNSNFNDK